MYGVTSIISFICIVKIRPYTTDEMINDSSSSFGVCFPDNWFGSFGKSFHYWLYGLHVVLILPLNSSAVFLNK